ncbi:phosphotransferase [Arthrobacter sp. LAPM80]|uniref:phosphotransferase n=1 Tax=Arthrobacter sp. LAPM80 TaxID=3141788 RepID=UPI00398AE6ED
MPPNAMPFRAVVKVVQSPPLWSGIGQVPAHFKDGLVRHYPWHTEVKVYSSDLALAMPDGGRLRKVYAITALDEQRTAIWMEDVAECSNARWTDEVFRHAANLLGRLAGSGPVRDSGPVLSPAKDADRLRFYLDSVGTTVYIPSLRGEESWKIPAVAEAANAELISRLRALTDRAHLLVHEVLELPTFPAHGDASPQNLLIEATHGGQEGCTEFVVIDWGSYRAACAGFDLGQLLAGPVNQGCLRGEELYRLEPLCLKAFREGLAESGVNIPESEVRRGFAMTMALFTGMSAVPSQRVDEPDSEELRAFMAERIAMARFVLELLDSTD